MEDEWNSKFRQTLIRLDRRAVAESAILHERLALVPSIATDLSMECTIWIQANLRRECLEYRSF